MCLLNLLLLTKATVILSQTSVGYHLVLYLALSEEIHTQSTVYLAYQAISIHKHIHINISWS